MHRHERNSRMIAVLKVEYAARKKLIQCIDQLELNINDAIGVTNNAKNEE